MQERGFEPDMSPAVLAEMQAIRAAAPCNVRTRDLRSLCWCSIDNDDSRDLDQLTVAEALPNREVRVLVAIADVSGLVRKGSAIDGHARNNTTSIYTAAQMFPMLPEGLSTDLTSLNFAVDRNAVVVEMLFSDAGKLLASDVFEAVVHNRAKLAYNSVAAWLDGVGPEPLPLTAVAGLAENIRLQHQIAQKLRGIRQANGALTFETIKPKAVFEGKVLTDLAEDKGNCAKQIIENFMVAANGVTAKFLASRSLPSIRRVVRVPKNWESIVELAASRGTRLPARPEAKALANFLNAALVQDPVRFPDLSLAVVKLLGSGEYVLELPGDDTTGHFGLAVREYSHSTAPNRRFPDLITQRLLKAAMVKAPSPYETEELDMLAQHCTEQEDDAKKIERQVAKAAAALLLAPKIGEEFDALVTGAADKGTWVRLITPPVEGKLIRGADRRKVGERVRVRLVEVNTDRGHIDFALA
jgi:exoribonuclease-2